MTCENCGKMMEPLKACENCGTPYERRDVNRRLAARGFPRGPSDYMARCLVEATLGRMVETVRSGQVVVTRNRSRYKLPPMPPAECEIRLD